MTVASPLTYSPLKPSPQADPAYFADFGREVHGFDPVNAKDHMPEIIESLYKVCACFEP